MIILIKETVLPESKAAESLVASSKKRVLAKGRLLKWQTRTSYPNKPMKRSLVYRHSKTK